ncbi:hypothetical protein L6452_01292 [Arctium lappa]|uniref:Uncharacterized protein n=1 Tax=Arctium lappa TaxID=4217 RepID=A0ACB9FFQ4_ARCLA|nr:hypothetical protein L6452_01292 [Arctium lappa]
MESVLMMMVFAIDNYKIKAFRAKIGDSNEASLNMFRKLLVFVLRWEIHDAIVGVLGSIKMPYPSKAFDMAHCSRCLIPWGSNDGKYMMPLWAFLAQ